MNILASILSSRVRAEMFRLLFGLDQREIHLRELGRRSSLHIETIRQDLRTLVRLDLVQARRNGNRIYYKANQNHPLYPDIHQLVLKTSGLVEALRQMIGTAGVSAAFVFGSVATGRMTAGSDIDLMVIGRITLRQLVRRLAGVSDQLGREVNPHILTPAEFRKRRRSKEHFVTSVVASPKIFILGTQDDLEAMAG